MVIMSVVPRLPTKTKRFTFSINEIIETLLDINLLRDRLCVLLPLKNLI